MTTEHMNRLTTLNPIPPQPVELNAFTRAYLECALWSSHDESDESGGEPMDANYTLDDIAPPTVRQAQEDCAAFQRDNADALAVYLETFDLGHAGHDYWLSRCSHGAGYWDRTSASGALYDACQKLTDAAHADGNVDLYVGDDGLIYG